MRQENAPGLRAHHSGWRGSALIPRPAIRNLASCILGKAEVESGSLGGDRVSLFEDLLLGYCPFSAPVQNSSARALDLGKRMVSILVSSVWRVSRGSAKSWGHKPVRSKKRPGLRALEVVVRMVDGMLTS